jgi:hypothetical protein
MQNGINRWSEEKGVSEVKPGLWSLAINYNVRCLCEKPYYNHKKGCPNYGRKDGCPPMAPYIDDIADINLPLIVLWNKFFLAAQTALMRDNHPKWSERQCANCLYWQGAARKELRQLVSQYMIGHEGAGLISSFCPEANGLNITKLMEICGVDLEWPPGNYAYQVAIVYHRATPSSIAVD